MEISVFKGNEAGLELVGHIVVVGESPLPIAGNSSTQQLTVLIEDYCAGGFFKNGSWKTEKEEYESGNGSTTDQSPENASSASAGDIRKSVCNHEWFLIG